MVEMATGIPNPAWPMPRIRKVVALHGGRAFGARRAGGRRSHVGIDILAPEGAEVVSMEDGQVVATQRFNGPRAHAILIENDTGTVVLYGEVEPGSWRELGVEVGDRVSRGQPIARVGVNPKGSTMLHLETYRSGTRSNQRWYSGRPMPTAILDPTEYLISSADGPVESVEEPPHEHEVEGDDDAPDVSTGPMPSTPGPTLLPDLDLHLPEPRPPSTSSPPSSSTHSPAWGLGAGLLALLFLTRVGR